MTRTQEPIAIIGMSCRVAGAEGLDPFWRMMAAGSRMVGPVPERRLVGLDTGHIEVDRPQAAMLDDITGFDAAFFGISRRMAAWADPQQRLLLELAWQAVEDAGIDPDGLRGAPVAVFAGACAADYRERMVGARRCDTAAFTGTLNTFLANLISYQFDWTGPSYAVDSACSSGLTAVHAAVTGLRCGDFPVALAGASNVICNGFYSGTAYRAGALSPTGDSIPFAADRNGYVRGEGGACVLLKRLDDAIGAGDPIHAVIRDISVAHDGRAGGLTGTDPATQASLITRTARRTGVPLDGLGYFEAHGPGTGGDLTEVIALQAALTGHKTAAGPGGALWVGSVKANIGHLEAAAGLVALVKCAMVVSRGFIPRVAGLKEPDPRIRSAEPLIRLATEEVEWPRAAEPRRAAVNSFGVGGALAHALIEEPPVLRADTAGRGVVPVPLSAATEPALRQLADRVRSILDGPYAPAFASTAWTLQSGRRSLARRAVVLASGTAGLCAGLSALSGEEPADANVLRPGHDPGPGGSMDVMRRWLGGQSVTWPEPGAARRASLAPYPFQRTPCWFDTCVPTEKGQS